MRRIRSILYGISATAVLAAGLTPAAAYVDQYHRPPPAWYTAPRLTHTYSQTWGAGYSHASTHEYSAQRRYSYTGSSRRYHDPYGRW